MAQPGRRRPLSLVLLTFLLLLLVGAAVAVFFGGLRPAGSIPRRAAVASLAVLSNGFMVGTSNGAYQTGDGKEWSPYPNLSGAVAVASGSEVPTSSSPFTAETFVSAGKNVLKLGEAIEVTEIPTGQVTALAVGPGGVWAATRSGTLFHREFRGWEDLGHSGPNEVLALAVPQVRERFTLAGGIASGLWRSVPAETGLEWSRILRTPVTAIVIDPDDANRVLIGTPGGILLSGNRGDSWRFTGFRKSVSGLTTDGREFFAISDRILYRSSDGDKDWTPLIATR